MSSSGVYLIRGCQYGKYGYLHLTFEGRQRLPRIWISNLPISLPYFQKSATEYGNIRCEASIRDATPGACIHDASVVVYELLLGRNFGEAQGGTNENLL
jgi:hypothetical protein